MLGGRGGIGPIMTRSDRSRPVTTTGRSARTNASRATSYPESITMSIGGSPGAQCPAATISRSTTSRSWAAVTAVASSSGPSRTASNTAVRLVRPASNAATIEYGQPGIIWLVPVARP